MRLSFHIAALISIAVLSIIIIFGTGTGFGASCYSYTTQGNCDGDSSCTWRSDAWGGWCEEKGCWNYWTEAACPVSISGTSKNCTWQSSASWGWCETPNCWTYSGTNESACESNAAGLSCTWRGECMMSGTMMGGSMPDCWSITDSSTCGNTTGCKWGNCNQQSCWDYTASATCAAGTGYEGGNCTWNSEYNYCYEQGCWDYSNQTGCQNDAPSSLNCMWKNGYCSKTWCSDYSYTNAGNCTGNSLNLSCTWNDPWCNDQGCWNYMDQNSCTGQSGCTWKTSEMSGWCEEVQCWTWDSWGGGNESACVNNTYGLSCAWDGFTAGNATDGWCWKNMTSVSCSNITTERACMDTYHCWWQFTDWNDPSLGGTCNSPGGFGLDVNTSFFTEWNPGCYIFDANQSSCSNVTGCTWSDSACASSADISGRGLHCSDINDSSICNSIPVLSNCCIWQGGTCTNNTYSNACWDDLSAPPEGASFCEDYNAYTSQQLCNQIANSPWYMPCSWDNATGKCGFKSSSVFTSGTESIIIIDNKEACKAAGGKWLIENYCEGNISVPTGRCENKFDEERNCDKACFACEYASDGSAHNSTKAARDACGNSKLGYCSFTEDSSALNGFGYCNAKDEFKKGIAADCNSDCGACTFKGNANAAEAKIGTTCKKPSCFCESSAANCKWIPDPAFPTDENKGMCASQTEKSCEERCDKCYTEDKCTQYGKGGNSACRWNAATYVCEPTTTGGEAAEVCWDGIDNDDDGKMDCADSQCFSDPFCGGGFMSSATSCAGFASNATCISNNCTWVNETWWEGCDMPGMDCWKYDGSESECAARNSTCDWHSGFGGFCENNWSMTSTCTGYSDSATCNANNASGCVWNVDTWCQGTGGHCEGGYTCTTEPYYSNSTQCLAQSGCNWFNASWCEGGSGWCDHSSFSCWKYSTQSTCEDSESGGGAWCSWEHDQYSPSGGWCESMSSCWDFSTAETCGANNCTWTAGFCDPKGFGGEMMPGSGGGGGTATGGFGIACYKYDGNQSGCANQTGCGWFQQPTPMCEVDFSTDCMQYSYNETLCNQQQRCKWRGTESGPFATGSWCDNKVSECWWNQSLQSSGNCTANTMCTWKGWGCEPGCFAGSINTQASCLGVNATVNSTLNVSACIWKTGWCNPASTTQMFTGMEGGAPVKLGDDDRGDAYPNEVDIISYGMKDMGDSYGFGVSTVDFRNASVCNGIWMSTGTGAGTSSVKFFIYLDTDGRTTGNCALKNDATAAGYDFYFRYGASNDNSTGKTTETINAYKCTDGTWGPSDIILSSWPYKMCNEIQGGMIAVKKGDLKKFPTLYNSSADIRVYVASANATMNATSPTDTAAAAWTTPGSIDFEIQDLFKYGADAAKSEDILKKGYVQFEDCFNSVDDDADGMVDCSDYDCQFAKKCEGTGVNAPGFSDTRAPQVTGVKIETYSDAALIMYDTNKPANGTVQFYGNSATCASLNATIYDIGVLKNESVREYKVWHTTSIYNGTNSLDYTLANDTIYYYKIKVCDTGDKCALSKCSNITTSSVSKCGYCNFVTRLKAPTGWTVSYDVDQDGMYEHVQGQVCGPKAGMKTNYTAGRKVNIVLNETATGAYMQFLNASLTRTGLNDKVRSMNGSSSLIMNNTATDSSGNTIGYVGMFSETRDKIINNLYPEECRIAVPKGDTSCTELWHCDDSGANCINRTAESALINTTATLCLWRIPFCEFSTWASGQPGTSSDDTTTTSSSSGGGGGGGGGSTGTSETVTVTSIAAGGSQKAVFTKVAVAFTFIEVFASSAIASGSITVTDTNKPTNIEAPVPEETAAVYKYLDISTDIGAGNISKLKMRFRVNKTWVNDNNIDYTTIALQRHSSDTWTKFGTSYISQDDDFRVYEAESPGLSLFAITGEKSIIEELIEGVQEQIGSEEPAAELPAEEVPAEEAPAEALPPLGTAVIIIIIAIAIVAVFGWSYFHRHAHKWKSGVHKEAMMRVFFLQ